MKQFKCWIAERGETEDSAKLVKVAAGWPAAIENIACTYVEDIEDYAESEAERVVMLGLECAIVSVRDLGTGKLFNVMVDGELIPSYSARRVVEVKEEPCYNAPFYVYFTGIDGMEHCLKYATAEMAKRGADYISGAGGHMIRITDNDDQFVPFEGN